jgi:hypothetical protein
MLNKFDLFAKRFDKELFRAVFITATEEDMSTANGAAQFAQKQFMNMFKLNGYSNLDTSIVSATDVEAVRDVVVQITSHPSSRKEARATVLLRQNDGVITERKQNNLTKMRPSRFPGVDFDYRGQNAHEGWARRKKVIDAKQNARERRKTRRMNQVILFSMRFYFLLRFYV